VDLWHYETAHGRGIRKALDWLIPYSTGAKEWPYQQIGPLRGGSLTLLRRAALAYREEHYERLIEKLPGGGDLGTVGLLYPNPR
jgi:hypothetical protein